MKTPLPFGVSEFTTWPWPFERDLQRYAANGFAAIEICEFKLDKNDYGPQLNAIAGAGLAVSSVQSEVHSLFPDSLAGQPAAPEDRMRHIKAAIERIAPYVPEQTPFVVITGAAPGGDTAMVYERSLAAFEELAEFAAQHEMRVAYEPLNPILFNTDTALWGLDQALEFVQRVGHEALGVCVDTWNIFQTAALHEVIRACGDRIFLVQVSDWRRPRSGADRVSLGDGEIDNTSILRTIRSTGYCGSYVLEIFSGESLPGSIWRSDLDAVLCRNLHVFEDMWEASMP